MPVRAPTPSAIEATMKKNLLAAGRNSRHAMRSSNGMVRGAGAVAARGADGAQDGLVDDAPVAQVYDAVCEPAERRVVRYQHERRPLAPVQLEQQLEHDGARRAVQRSEERRVGQSVDLG